MSIPAQGLEVIEIGGIKTVATVNPGTTWVQLPEVTCTQVVIYNDTGGALSAQYCSDLGVARDLLVFPAESSLRIPDGTAQPFRGLSNAQQIRLRRFDTNNSVVTVKFTWEKA